MTQNIPSATDRLAAQIEHTLQQSRHAVRLLSDSVIPHLQPGQRSFPVEMMQKIERGRLFNEPMLREIDALIRDISREAETGTYNVWEYNEYHDNGGSLVTCYNAEASALLAGADSLHRLQEAIARVVDIRRSHSIAATLSADD